MRALHFFTAAALLLGSVSAVAQETYQPSAENIQNRQDFVNERFGIFLHWGMYSLFGQNEWYLNNGEVLHSEYSKGANAFYPHDYDALEWVRAFKDAGAKYVTLTSRHHDGFSMFDTAVSDYDIVDATPYGKDISKDLDEACKSEGLALHFYYSLLDWGRDDYPLGGSGRKTGKDTTKADYGHYLEFMKAQMTELLTQYNTRALWFDGMWDHKEKDFDWKMQELYAHIHNVNPAALIGNNHHVMPLEGEDFQMFERDLPGQNTAGYSDDLAVSDKLPLEMCQTLNHNWGYRVFDCDYKSSATVIQTLAKAVALNSNLLLNIGPQPDGKLPDRALAILKEIGVWMRANGESIYGCGPGPLAEQPWGVTTAPMDKGAKAFYLHFFSAPEAPVELTVDKKAKVLAVTNVADGSPLEFTKKKDKLTVTGPASVPADAHMVVKVQFK